MSFPSGSVDGPQISFGANAMSWVLFSGTDNETGAGASLTGTISSKPLSSSLLQLKKAMGISIIKKECSESFDFGLLFFPTVFII
jgi:hypothetical protein